MQKGMSGWLHMGTDTVGDCCLDKRLWRLVLREHEGARRKVDGVEEYSGGRVCGLDVGFDLGCESRRLAKDNKVRGHVVIT